MVRHIILVTVVWKEISQRYSSSAATAAVPMVNASSVLRPEMDAQERGSKEEQ